MDMRKIIQYDDVIKFQAVVIEHLKRYEAENNLIIGLLDTLSQNKYHYSDIEPLLLVIYNEDKLSSVSIMTPPYNIIVSKAENQDLELLANYIYERKICIPGVLGPNREAEVFANYYSDLSSKKFEIEMNERIYQIDNVESQSMPNGKMRFATMNDYVFLKDWARSFAIDAKMSEYDIEKTAERFKKKISDKAVAIWDDGEPRAMATYQGKTPNGVRIGHVYTPDEFRKNGFGGAVTASLTEYLLNNGNKFCFLFTDLDNPTSNSIYKKIGYKEVCDFNMLKFQTAK